MLDVANTAVGDIRTSFNDKQWDKITEYEQRGQVITKTTPYTSLGTEALMTAVRASLAEVREAQLQDFETAMSSMAQHGVDHFMALRDAIQAYEKRSMEQKKFDPAAVAAAFAAAVSTGNGSGGAAAGGRNQNKAPAHSVGGSSAPAGRLQPQPGQSPLFSAVQSLCRITGYCLDFNLTAYGISSEAKTPVHPACIGRNPVPTTCTKNKTKNFKHVLLDPQEVTAIAGVAATPLQAYRLFTKSALASQATGNPVGSFTATQG